MRTKRGYILMQGKKHFVHEGLNIIGRNKTATVIIPDVSVSHYHSSIVVINDNHYLCDITSSNGTYLKELKLNPLQLYELDNGQNLKIGTVKASYYKLTNNFDATAANEEDQQLTYEENVFDAKTQLYDVAEMQKPTQNANIEKSIEEDISLSKLDSINDVPTQIFENHDGLELVLNGTENSLNLDNVSGITSTSRDSTSINFLPTQIVGLIKEEDAESERGSPLAADVSIHNLPTQLICSTKDRENEENIKPQDTSSDAISTDDLSKQNISLVKVTDPDQTCDVVEETVLDKSNDSDDENSRESTDFLTMQPAATQNFNSDSQSQLFLQHLQRKVRYVISSDDESHQSSRENSQKKKVSRTPSKNEQDVSDEETDVEYSQIKMKKLTKKTIFDSDSDGDSTDVELPTGSDQEKMNVSPQEEMNVPAQEKLNVSNKAVDSDALDINFDTGVQLENQQANPLDDSDIIQTTQDCPRVPNATTAGYRNVEKNHQEERNSLEDTNMEASLADSFHLALTEPDEKSENNVPLVQNNIFLKESDKSGTSTVQDLNADQINNKLVDDVPHTQLEVIFDDTNLPVEVDRARPSNPILNILASAESPKEEESVEDKLAKMFQSQVEPMRSNKDDIFVQPTQLIECTTSTAIKDDVFLVPRQKQVVNKNYEKNAVESIVENAPKKNVPEDRIDPIDNDIFLQPTQIVSAKYREPVITAQKDDHVQISNTKETEDGDIFLQPTQIVAPEHKKPVTAAQNNDIVQTSNRNESEDDDIFLQPTQIVAPENKKPATTAQKIDIVQTTNRKESEDDIFLQPTQIVAPEQKEPIVTPQKTDTVRKETEDDDIFLQPTQIAAPEPVSTAQETGHVQITNRNEKENDATLEDCTLSNEDKVNESRIKPFEKDKVDTREYPKSTKLTCFLNSLMESSDSEDTDVDSNFSQSEKTESANVSKDRKISTRNTKKQDNNSMKEEKTVLKSKATNKSSLRLRSRNTDRKNIDVVVESLETIPNIEEVSANNAKKTSEHKQNESSKKGSTVHTDTVVTKIMAVDVPPNKITTTTLKEEDKEQTSNSSEGELISSKPTRVSLRRKRNQELKETDKNNTISEITALSKTKMSNNAAEFCNDQEKNKVTIADKLQVNQTTDSLNKKNENATQKPRTKGTKLKQVDDQNDSPTKKSKVANLKTNERNTLRRSTRRKSVEEENEEVKANSKNKELDVIKEINTSPIRTENTTSDDEFVDTNRKTPLTISRRGKRAVTAMNNKGKECENENTSPHVNIVSTRSKRTNKAGSVRQPETNDYTSSSENASIEEITNHSLSPSTSEINDDTIKSDVKRCTRKRKESLNNKEDQPSTSATARPKKPKVEQNKETDRSCNENQSFVRTRKSSQQKEDSQQNDKEDKSEIMLARRSKKFKTEENAIAEEKNKEDSVMLTRRSRKFKLEEEDNTENEVSCSEASTVASSSSDTRTRKSRQHRSLSKTSEDDFRVTKAQRERKPTLMPSTPERTKRILKPRIVFTMLDSPQLETIIRSLGGFVVESIETSTVLVTSTIKRSQKLLSAIGLAKPICSPKWLHDSKSANMFLDPWQYILEDGDAETKWKFSLKESLRRSSNNKLMENYTFQIMANSLQDVLKGSIESCGGKCVSRTPSKDNQINFIVIATPENKNKYNKLLKQNPAPKIVAPEAIFDGILRQELHFEDHLLS